MPTIGRIGAIQIRIYYDDHGIPHFHAVAGEFDFKFAISDCSIISGTGRVRAKDIGIIRAWGRRHRNVLMTNWQLARDGEPLRDIED
jgi:hypothetical protein